MIEPLLILTIERYDLRLTDLFTYDHNGKVIREYYQVVTSLWIRCLLFRVRWRHTALAQITRYDATPL